MFYRRAITAFAEFYPEPPTVILWREKQSNAWTRYVLYYHTENTVKTRMLLHAVGQSLKPVKLLS